MNKILFLALLACSLSVSLAAAVSNCALSGTTTGGDDACETCDDNYYGGTQAEAGPPVLYSNCLQCKSGCKVCTTGSDCTECQDNYHAVPATGTITSCAAGCTVDGCATCNGDDNKCTACSDGYYPVGSAGDYTCSACSDAIDGCTKCTNANTCTACTDGQGVSNKKCAACSVTNCATCSANSAVCDTCSSGYNFPTGNTKGDTCSLCTNNCKTCDSKIDQSCSSGCQTGLTLNNTDTSAQFCCSKDCTQCTSASVCTKCKDGVDLNSDNNTCFGFKTGASLFFGAIVAVFALLF